MWLNFPQERSIPSYDKWLSDLRLLSVKKMSLRGDLIALYSYLKRDCSKVDVSLFSQ